MAKRNSGKLNKRLLSDARGEMVKPSPLDNKYVRILCFIVFPYILVNGLIFILVCSGPRISIDVGDTNDYRSTLVSVTVKSLLPVSSVEITEESESLPYERSGSTYAVTVTQNGSFIVRASSINGMSAFMHTDISILDDSAPQVDESSAVITDSRLSFVIADTQSGVDFDSIYGIVNEEETIYPESIDKEQGLIVMELPSDTETVDLYFEDMVGNARNGRITVTVEGVDTVQDDDSDKYNETDDIEDSIPEYTE